SWDDQRGYNSREDRFTPGAFRLTLKRSGSFTLCFRTSPLDGVQKITPPKRRASRAMKSRLETACEQFFITRGKEFHSVVAGFPWFGEWGRDTMLSLPGLC